MFINLSNHPSIKWEELQLNTAREYGEVVDIPFPAVAADASEDDIEKIVSQLIIKVSELAQEPKLTVVMLQGEYTLTYALVNALKKAGYKVVAACTSRNVIEKTDENGNTVRESRFDFVRFREYR